MRSAAGRLHQLARDRSYSRLCATALLKLVVLPRNLTVFGRSTLCLLTSGFLIFVLLCGGPFHLKFEESDACGRFRHAIVSAVRFAGGLHDESRSLKSNSSQRFGMTSMRLLGPAPGCSKVLRSKTMLKQICIPVQQDACPTGRTKV